MLFKGLNLSMSQMPLLGECVISLVLSHCNKNLKPWTDQCYCSVLLGKTKASTHLRSEGGPTQKILREASGSNLAPLFKCFFSSPGPALCKLGQPGVLFIYLRSSLRSLYLPLFYFRGLCPCLLATAILDSFFLF